jgi:hypothetical protein
MKKIGKSDIIGQKGMSLIEGVVLSMGFMFYPTGGVEAGSLLDSGNGAGPFDRRGSQARQGLLEVLEGVVR